MKGGVREKAGCSSVRWMCLCVLNADLGFGASHGGNYLHTKVASHYPLQKHSHILESHGYLIHLKYSEKQGKEMEEDSTFRMRYSRWNQAHFLHQVLQTQSLGPTALSGAHKSVFFYNQEEKKNVIQPGLYQYLYQCSS